MTDDRIERVARALCALDGKEPDAKRQTGKMVTVRLHNGFSHEPETQSEWQFYLGEAARFVAAFEALQTQ